MIRSITKNLFYLQMYKSHTSKEIMWLKKKKDEFQFDKILFEMKGKKNLKSEFEISLNIKIKIS